MDNEILRTLRRLAEDVTPIQSARIAAAVVADGAPIAFGVNHMRSHPFQAKYGKNEQCIFWHAETNAVFNALRRVDPCKLAEADMYVVRVKRPSSRSRDFILGTAAPCAGCRKCIEDFKVRRVFYTTDEQTIRCE